MRKYVLTPHEHEVINLFLKEGIKVSDFGSVLQQARDKQAIVAIKEDLKLIEQFLKKAQ